MSDEAEGRERIKLNLEYTKLALSMLGVVTILVGVWQWQLANRIAKQTVYQKMTSEWRDHLKTFIDKPDLRPYFEGGKELQLDDGKTAQTVLAIADVRLDTADAILSYAALHDPQDDIGGWKNTFSRAFQTSPVLCSRLKETRTNYGLVVPIADAACPR